MMDRETEMYHAAIRILENRSEQLGDDELMHKVDNADLLKKKERMLNQSKWERNKRTKKYDPETGIMYDRGSSDPDIYAEAGKHGYIDLADGRAWPHKGGRLYSGPVYPNKSGVSGSDTAAAKKFSEVLDNTITDEQIRDMFKNGNSRKDIAENIYWKVYKAYGSNPTNLPIKTERWIDEKITKAIKRK